jgi:hypothetical protein
MKFWFKGKELDFDDSEFSFDSTNCRYVVFSHRNDNNYLCNSYYIIDYTNENIWVRLKTNGKIVKFDKKLNVYNTIIQHLNNKTCIVVSQEEAEKWNP